MGVISKSRTGARVSSSASTRSAVTFRPIRLRQHVVDNVESAGANHAQGFVQALILASHRIRENEIETRRRLALVEMRPHPRRSTSTVRHGRAPRAAAAWKSGLTSMLNSSDAASIPSRTQAVATPVPVPNSRNRPPGFDAASVRSRAPGAVFGCQLESKRLRFAFKICASAGRRPNVGKVVHHSFTELNSTGCASEAREEFGVRHAGVGRPKRLPHVRPQWGRRFRLPTLAPSGRHTGRNRAVKCRRNCGCDTISNPRMFILSLIHLENRLHQVIHVALRVHAARDRQSQQLMPRLGAEHHRSDLDRPHARMPVHLHRQRLTGKLRARNMRQHASRHRCRWRGRRAVPQSARHDRQCAVPR